MFVCVTCVNKQPLHVTFMPVSELLTAGGRLTDECFPLCHLFLLSCEVFRGETFSFYFS